MSQLTPYDYQEECLTVLQEERTEGKEKALVVMASGLGKTVIAAFEVSSYFSRHGGRVLFLCHQNDILDQAYDTFAEVLGPSYSFGYLDGRRKEFELVDVLFGSFQTMHNWRNEFHPKTFDYIIVDESHHSPAKTYLPTLEYFEPRFLLGVTATPDRMDLQDIREIYGDEVYSLPLEDGLAQGLLAPVEYRLVTDEIQNLSVLDTPIGKLSIKMLNRELFIPKRDEEIAKIIQEKITEVHGPRVMIFAPSIAYCNRLAALLPEAFSIHSEMPLNEQADILRKFRAQEINTVITVDKFNEGIDVPDANIIVFLRSTASRTIFFQQLGRGLRKTEGKERVLVLDFVANCERLEMVHKLWAAVEGKVIGPGPVYPPIEGPFIVDIGKIEFTQDVRNVLDVIKGVRIGYTKEILLKQLIDLASELGRTPSIPDVNEASKQGKIASVGMYQKHFGSYVQACKRAGLAPNWMTGTDEELLGFLKSLADEIGRTPILKDVAEASKEGKCASVGHYYKRFDSFTNALIKAGLTPHRFQLRKSDEELLSDLQILAKKLNKRPSYGDVVNASKEGKCAGYGAYVKRFGSFTKALEKAGLTPPKRTFTDGELLEMLRILAEELGHTPTQREVNQAAKEGKAVYETTYRKRFGTLTSAVVKAGLPTTRKTKAELLRDLRDLAKKLGRTPRIIDVQEAYSQGEYASSSVYISHFGTYTKACKKAGLVPNKRGRPAKKSSG